MIKYSIGIASIRASHIAYRLVTIFVLHAGNKITVRLTSVVCWKWWLCGHRLLYKAFVQQTLKLGRNHVCIHIHEWMSRLKITWERKLHRSKLRKLLEVLRTFAPGSESSGERKFQGANSIPWYFRSRERKFHNSRQWFNVFIYSNLGIHFRSRYKCI